MKNLLSILFIFIAILASGQDLKTKKKKIDEQEGTATFYVLASNDSIKHGIYQKKGYTGKRILLKGNYNHNKKEGLWQEQYYGDEYKGPKASGYYENDLKIGEWVYFNYAGDTVQIYDWSQNKLVFSKPCGIDTSQYVVIKDGQVSLVKLDCPPTCVSGLPYFFYGLLNDLRERTEYYTKIREGAYQLKTKITTTISENSSIKEITYSTSVAKELKEIIDTYIKSFKWIPGRKEGLLLTTKYEVNLNITIQN